jgi:hypothetical protein
MEEKNKEETNEQEAIKREKPTKGEVKKTAAKSAAKKAAAKKAAANKATAKKSADSSNGRTRMVRPYPVGSFEESFEFSKSIYDFGSGQKVRRLAIFNELGKSPDSSASRMLITNGNKYGLIRGNYTSEFLELTEDGMLANREDLSEYERHRTKLKLVIERIDVFNFLYNRFVGNKLPNQAVIADIIKEEFKDINPEDVNQVVDLFVVNAQYLKLLKVISGAERLVNFEHCLEDFSKTSSSTSTQTITTSGTRIRITNPISDKLDISSLEELCFYITPIGSENSEERQHSDLFLGSIVEPALESLNLKVIRADQIDKPGTITKQIIEYLSKAKLVIADLSFNNPNVFYELAIRHAFRLPTVQIIRKGDKIPFDVSNSRTIVVDNTDIYSLIPKLDTYKSEIASQVRQALGDPDAVDNPLTLVYPNIKLNI